MTTRPLRGLSVVEAASYLSGPFATLALADLGAEVIKVEPPEGGDPYRRYGPADEHGGVMFRAANRNKRSVAIDLKTDDGARRFHGLLSDADVLISNWRPDVSERLGLTGERVRSDHPALVWVRVSGYGQNGPMAEAAVFDSIIQARTGALDEMGLLPIYLADKITAMLAVQATLAAVLQRENSGQGSIVDISMLDALAYFNGPDLFAGHQREDVTEPRVMRQMRATRPLATSDGQVVIAPLTGRQLKRALAVAGVENRAEELKSLSDSTLMTERFYEIMEARLTEQPTAHWVRSFTEADVPVTDVLSLEDHLRDPQVLHNELYRIVDEPGLGKVRRLRYPALFDGDAAETDDLGSPPLSD